MDNRISRDEQDRDREVVEFAAEMPRFESDDLEFLGEDQYDEELADEI
jgi:hypothetical protein